MRGPLAVKALAVEAPLKPTSMGWDVSIGPLDAREFSRQLELYENGLQRYFVLSGHGTKLIPPTDFMTKILGFPEEEAKEIVKQAAIDIAQAETDERNVP